jgi:GTP-binding protein
VLDLRPLDGSDPATNYQTVERELRLHDPRLSALPRVIALSKADLVDEPAQTAARTDWVRRVGADLPVIVTSAVTRQGLEELARELLRRVGPADARGLKTAAEPLGDLAEHRVYRPATSRAYTVERIAAGSYRVSGTGVERLVARYDLGNEEALAHLERRLRGIGVLRALEVHGFEPGDDVEIAGIAFDLDPEPHA